MIFTAILLIAGLFALAYILLSAPPVQNSIRQVAEKELSVFLNGRVEIAGISISPFNEVVVKGLTVYDAAGTKCLSVETLGAGISLWRLLRDGKIELTYGEIIGLDATIVQKREGEPLNIQFIIDAFKPKNKNKPPTKFDLQLRSVVMRRCHVSFDREWIPAIGDPGRTDFNHLRLDNLRADINVPRLRNNDFTIDLRRLSFELSGGLTVEKIAFKTHITDHSISVDNLAINLPGTELRPSDFSLNFNGFGNILEALKMGSHHIVLLDNVVTPSDAAALCPQLRMFASPFYLSMEATGNMTDVSLNELRLSSGNELSLLLKGKAEELGNKEEMSFEVEELRLHSTKEFADRILAAFPGIKGEAAEIIGRAMPLSIEARGKGNPGKGDYVVDGVFATLCGALKIETSAKGVREDGGNVAFTAETDGFNVMGLLGKGKVGNVAFQTKFDGSFRGKDIEGIVTASIPQLEFNEMQAGGIEIEGMKKGKEVSLQIDMANDVAELTADAEVTLDGAFSEWKLNGEIDKFYPSYLGFLPKYEGYNLKCRLSAEGSGSNPDNASGHIGISGFNFSGPDGRKLYFSSLDLTSENSEERKTITLASDWIDGKASGRFRIADIGKELRCMAAAAFPSLVVCGNETDLISDVEFDMLVKPDNTWTEFFNMPFRLLVGIPIEGKVDGTEGKARLTVDIPYLQQGKSKLLRDNRITADLDGNRGSYDLNVASTFPVKKGEMELDVRLWGQKDNVMADIGWNMPENPDFNGRLSLGAELSKSEMTSAPEVNLEINPSTFNVGSARWNVDKGFVAYKGKQLGIDGLKIWHDGQFLEINGDASQEPEDVLKVSLAQIDLGYIFETLNINYVTFAGEASGDIYANSIFSKEPEAFTDNLLVKGLSYNGTVLGDGAIKSRWNNDEKEVEIYADIRENGVRKAEIEGGIWVTRDSLSIGIEADRVRVGFLGPFMSAFASDVDGYASGNARLFGTFKDIDLTGRLYADSLHMKLDYTNTVYHGSDSVFFTPGKIEIPSFRLYDRYGNSGIFSGELTHRYFHDPRFTFRLSDARNLLCYDTNSKINPDWYGTIYGNGTAIVRGWPGIVSVSLDMSVERNSTFTFVLNDTEAAQDYNFLTFSDRRKEAREAERDSVPDVLAKFRKQNSVQEESHSNFMLDIRATVSPTALLTLVMDPVAGDKITARGNGALQIEYETESDAMQMFGKYTLEEGNYNFSLQDLILRDFKIRQGSSISFNGDPLNALLDITASYRVNTNLSDLDKSFSTDPELTRTNVPVDAMLMVKGEMEHPDITFDIELPTLTQDVGRKVKSIISTDDMMSRQIIYLLALNRFYTPEYMGSTSNGGGELAAVASSTLSTQLQNMLGQLTDKFTVAPSIRSDKGDFSDVEVDVALSSRLLNNRLLINGNFGYRDPTTSTTTFVGDFDIEYLLNRNGNLRLKAYNHFNDQNYYLREALTTQGLGVVYRRDFDDPFTFLKRKRKKETEEPKDSVPSDSITVVEREKSR